MAQLIYKDISTPGIITDVNPKDGVIEGYFSIFGNIDSDGDMIMPGAYTKTLSENGSRIKHLWQHITYEPIAVPTITQDSKGLKFFSKISQTETGKKALILYADGVVDEHSVGFETIKKQKKGAYTEITEIKLWEGSTVTWGANQFAQGGPAKSMFTQEQVFSKMDILMKAYRNGKYEDESIFDTIDLYIKQLQSYLIDLTKNTTIAAEQAQEPEEVKESEGDLYFKQKLQSLTALFK